MTNDEMLDAERAERERVQYEARIKQLEALEAHAEKAEARVRELEAEINLWRGSHGPLGPQTPEEVPVFLREYARVDGQTASLLVSKAETEARALREKIERAITTAGKWALFGDSGSRQFAAEIQGVLRG